jgi:hypothetical protein
LEYWLGKWFFLIWIFIYFNISLDSSALRIYKLDDMQIGYGNLWSPVFNTNNEYKFGDNSIVDVEVDMNKKIIHYFINNNLCPYYHSDISSFPLLFGISGIRSKGIIEIICVKKTRKSSVNPSTKCEAMKWIKVLFFFNYFVYYYSRKTKGSVCLCQTFLDKNLFILFNKIKKLFEFFNNYLFL